jgi:hypothetical protein
VASLVFVAADHEAAHKRDEDHLAFTLAELHKGNENVLESLELQKDQIMEAIRGLRDVCCCSRRIHSKLMSLNGDRPFEEE